MKLERWQKEIRNNLLNKLSYSELRFKGLLDYLDIKYEQQYCIVSKGCTYFVDFYLDDTNTVIEIDGYYHDDNLENDKIREDNIISEGYKLKRVHNDVVETLLTKGEVLKKLLN